MPMSRTKDRFTIRCWLPVLLVWSLLLFPGLAAAQAQTGTVVPPTLNDVDPATTVPGEEVQVVGTGGFIQLADGSTDKSLRAFPLVFNGVALDVLDCVNDLCGGSLIVPLNTAPGTYLISTDGAPPLSVTVGEPPQAEPPPPSPPLVKATGFTAKAAPFNDLLSAIPNFFSSAKLRETDVVHFPDPTNSAPPLFITAVGTGSEIKLTSWTVGPPAQPLRDSIATSGFNVQLHWPGINGRILVSAARRNDGNLWLTSWRVNQNGLLLKLHTRGYGSNAGIIVTRYGVSGRRLGANLAEIVTSVVDHNSRPRLVIWHVDQNGNIVGKQDSGPIPGGLTVAGGSAPVVALQTGNEYVVNFKNSAGNITWQYWAVSTVGVPTLLRETAQRLNIRGAAPGSSTAGNEIAASFLINTGHTIARLNANVNAGPLPVELITYEHNRTAGSPPQYNTPYLISTSLNDLAPNIPGISIPQPTASITAQRYIVIDGLREAVLGKGAGMLLGNLPPNQPPAGGIGSVTKTMSAHLVLEQVEAGLISLDDCVTLTAGPFGGLPDDAMGNDQSYTESDGRIKKIVNGQPVNLAVGDQVSLRTLLYFSMMVSDRLGTLAAAVHAAQALADQEFDPDAPDKPDTFAELIGTSTSQGFWVNEMQNRAEALGMTDTLYCGPVGRCHSTPQDQVTFWRQAAFDDEFIDITAKLSFTSADVAAEQLRCGLQLETFIKASVVTYPGFQGSKDGDYPDNLGVDYVGNPPKLRCNQDVGTQGACVRCFGLHARRLERPLFVAQSQAPLVGNNTLLLLDYGYQQIFTPDRLADSGVQGGTVGDFALAHLAPVLSVSAGIVDDKRLEVCLWDVSEDGVQKKQCRQRTYAVLQAGPANTSPSVLGMVRVSSTAADADYLTGFKENGKLRLDLWRVGPRPE